MDGALFDSSQYSVAGYGPKTEGGKKRACNKMTFSVYGLVESSKKQSSQKFRIDPFEVIPIPLIMDAQMGIVINQTERTF